MRFVLTTLRKLPQSIGCFPRLPLNSRNAQQIRLQLLADEIRAEEDGGGILPAKHKPTRVYVSPM
jgi:hypothetical protein